MSPIFDEEPRFPRYCPHPALKAEIHFNPSSYLKIESMNMYGDKDRVTVPRIIASKFKQLLTEKHLYQGLIVLPDGLKGSDASEAEFELHTQTWNLRPSGHARENLSTDVDLRNIGTFCHKCKDGESFQPVHCMSATLVGRQESISSPAVEQIFLTVFRCQRCQDAEATFLISRIGPKLKIAGRWPMGEIACPPVIPQNFRNYYSQALITLQAGFGLAGAMYLRVLIEQYWKSKAPVENVRATGEELGSAYNKLLPGDFVNRFPNLLVIYNALSAAIHTGNIAEALVTTSAEEIVEHFDARRLFKLA